MSAVRLRPGVRWGRLQVGCRPTADIASTAGAGSRVLQTGHTVAEPGAAAPASAAAILRADVRRAIRREAAVLRSEHLADILAEETREYQCPRVQGGRSSRTVTPRLPSRADPSANPGCGMPVCRQSRQPLTATMAGQSSGCIPLGVRWPLSDVDRDLLSPCPAAHLLASPAEPEEARHPSSRVRLAKDASPSAADLPGSTKIPSAVRAYPPVAPPPVSSDRSPDKSEA